MKAVEYIVIGSGCSAAMAAQTLAEAGREVLILDVGNSNPDYQNLVPDKDYLELRRNDPNQYKYLIGEHAEGVVWGDVGKGAQITPPRKHMVEGVERYTPLRSKTFSPVESLGYGGLGIGWGLQCWEFSPAELTEAGLDPYEMAQAYETVAERIGVSATRDEAAEYTLGTLHAFQPSPTMDRNHKRIYARYTAQKQAFNKRGIFVGRTPLALLTKDKGSRGRYAYRDTDFYADSNSSAWRPWMTIDDLRKLPNVTYIPNRLVTRFEERGAAVTVHCLNTDDQSTSAYTCRTLVMATGAMASARIVLRSLQGRPDYHTRLPLLCNPYTYIPCVQPALLGKGVESKKLGFAQLTLFLDKSRGQGGSDLSVASLYAYQSLMLFRVIRMLPFNFVDAMKLLKYILSGLVIMGVHHPDVASPHKYVQLAVRADSPTGDCLTAQYALDQQTRRALKRREDVCIAAMRRMGCFALKRINPGYGSSIHYAGTLPYSNDKKPYALAPNGRLHGTQHVYVADSSGFTFLPAKGLTFTLLANAHRIAKGLIV